MNRVLSELFSLEGVDINAIDNFANNKTAYYKTYYIKTKTKVRRIGAPNEWLRVVQRHVSHFYQIIGAHKNASAYEKGCSTKKNALKHRKAEHVLHMDIKDFYASIGYRQFEAAYGKFYPSEELDILWKIASLNDGLPVGSCVSPIIANRVMYRVDKKLSRLSLTTKYTRYADDVIVSSKKFMAKTMIDKVNATVREIGLRINDEKTYFMGKRREVTGILVLDGGVLSLGTKYKKDLKGQVYKLLTRGEGNFKGIAGRIAYLNHIEPQYAQVLKRKYMEVDKIGLFKHAGVR